MASQRQLEVLQRRAGGLPGVVPALERGDHHRVDERGTVVVGLRCSARGRSSDQPTAQASGRRDGGPRRLTCRGARRTLPTCRTCRSTPASSTPSHERVVVADGAMGTMLQDAASARPGARRLRRARGLQRDPQRHPPGRRRRHPPRLLRGRRRRRGDQHVRGEPAQPRRVRHRRADPRARREGRAARPRGRRRDGDRRTGRGSCSARSARARSCPRWATSPSPGCATPTPSAAAGCSPAAADALVVETCQDLLQVKAAVLGAAGGRWRAEGRRVPIITHVTVETTGTMLLGSEIGAALTALEPLGVDLIGLNCATGPAEMSEHLRTLAKHARIPLSVMPNAGLPAAGPARRGVPAQPGRAGRGARPGSSATTGCGWSAAAAAPPRRTSRAVADAVRGRHARAAGTRARSRASARSTPPVPFRQDTSVLMVGERTNANGSQGVPRGDARRATGRTASRSPASRPATART